MEPGLILAGKAERDRPLSDERVRASMEPGLILAGKGEELRAWHVADRSFNGARPNIGREEAASAPVNVGRTPGGFNGARPNIGREEPWG